MNHGFAEWTKRAQGLSLRVQDFVDGVLQRDGDRREIKKYGPRDGKLLYTYCVSDLEQVNRAVSSARKAFKDGRWAKLQVHERTVILHRLADLLEQKSEELALCECLDVGKSISDALSFDIPAAAQSIRSSADGADKFFGKVYTSNDSNLSYELCRPIGVVAGIIGWNFPLYLAAQKIGPVLAAGNSLILKPSETTSLNAVRVAALAVEAGVPEGVFNVIHGDGSIGGMLAEHPDVDLVTFTGSTNTGKKLLNAAAESNMKALVLECGGKAPNIVFNDCPDLDSVTGAVVASAFWNQGEVCVATSRLLIQEELHDKFLEDVLRKTALLQVGDPLNPETTFGALVTQEHRSKVRQYIAIGQREGAHLYQTDFRDPVEGGFYVAPAVFDQVRSHHTIAQEEIFGPVLSVITFHDEDDAVRIANDTRYGLSATVWTRDIARVQRLSQRINAGWVVFNSTEKPQGGPHDTVLSIGGHKQSGIGVEGGIEGLAAYLSKTTIQVFV